MSSMKNLYANVQDALREGKSVSAVAKEFDLPAFVVREMQEDMVEYDAEFEGNV